MLNKNADQWLEGVVKRIVAADGSCYRETSILAQPHTLERDRDTWNDDHKVVNVVATTPEADGYCPGFAVDLVTGTICG